MSTYNYPGNLGKPVKSTTTSQPPIVTYFDPDGDLKVKAGSETQHEIFVVSSKVMSLTCKPWKAMFGADSQFVEGSRSPDTIIPLLDDNVNALKILLNAAHLRFSLVPKTLDFDTLLQVAILADKYDMAGIFQPWLDCWLSHATKNRKIPLHEGWLRISYTFGLSETFREAANLIVRDLEIERTFSLGTFSLGTLGSSTAGLKSRNGRRLEEDHLPSDILGNTRPCKYCKNMLMAVVR